jgi:hypothetical protein
MPSNNTHQTFGERVRAAWRRLLGGSHAKIVADAHARSAEFNALLMERRLKQSSVHTTPGTRDVPERWHTVSLGDVLTYVEQSRAPERATSLPDRAWGILQEVAEHFAANGKQLTDDDVLAMKSLLDEHEQPPTVMLTTLLERKLKRAEVADSIHLNTMKMTGGQ